MKKSVELAENIVRPIIPTMSRAKISHLLSYPIGAEVISTAVEEAAQFELLRLQFYMWRDHHLRWGRYEFLRVEYLSGTRLADRLPWRLFDRPPQYQWELVVQPVPKVFRKQIKDYALAEALPKIRQWLEQRSELRREGSDILSFWFEETNAVLSAEKYTRLLPER